VHNPQKFNIAYILGITLIAALGGLLFGYDWVVIGGAKFFYERYFNLTGIPSLQGLAMSSALIGCIPGALMAGYLSDNAGRKLSLSLAAILFVISALGTGMAKAFWIFMLFRIIGGIAIGTASVISPVYIAELAPRSIRGRFVSLNQLTIVIGILSAQLVNYYIAEEVPLHATDEMILNSWNGQMAWRWMFWAGTVPAILFLVLSFIIPESPRYLIKAGKPEKCDAVLAKIGGNAYAESVRNDILQSFSDTPGRTDLRLLADRKLRPILLLGLVLAAFQQWCGINIVFNYAEEVFVSAGFGITDSLFNIVITGMVNLVFTFVAIRTVDRWGRKKLMLIGAAGLAITYLILGFTYYSGASGIIVLLIIIAAIAIYGMSLAPVTWVILSEIFPNRVRGSAMALASATLWIASTLLVLLFPFINKLVKVSGAFWLYAFICLLGFLYIHKKLPETKGKSLEEVEKELTGQASKGRRVEA